MAYTYGQEPGGVADRLRVALDRAISVFSPGWALERAAARESLSAYRNATNRRTERGASTARTANEDLELGRDRWRMVGRMRDLERNSALAFALLRATVESVVGTGFSVDPQTEDEEWNKKARELWASWGETEADARGLATFDELLGLLFWSMLRDGDVGVVLLADGRLQTVESDLIASPFGSSARAANGRNMVDGVELDERGRPVKFWVLNETNGVSPARSKFTEVSADQFVFLARRTRLGQTRGLPAYAQTAWLFDQVDGYVEATTVAQRMAACFGLVLKRKVKQTGLPTQDGNDGETRRKMRAEPGMVLEVDPGEEVTTVQGAQPPGNLPDFIAMLVRLAAIVLGLPLEVALLDFSRTTYSSARAALLQAWQTWAGYQRLLKKFCTRIYLWKIAQWMDEGLLPARADADKHTWRAPGWRWLDPEKEIRAALAAIDGNLDTHAGVVTRMGGDPDEVLEQREREEKDLKRRKLERARSTLTRDPTPPGGKPADPKNDSPDGEDKPKGEE